MAEAARALARGGIVVERSTARGPAGPRLGHQVESKVPGRGVTGEISRTVGTVKTRMATGTRGVMVTVTAKSSGGATAAADDAHAVRGLGVLDVDPAHG